MLYLTISIIIITLLIIPIILIHKIVKMCQEESRVLRSFLDELRLRENRSAQLNADIAESVVKELGTELIALGANLADITELLASRKMECPSVDKHDIERLISKIEEVASRFKKAR